MVFDDLQMPLSEVLTVMIEVGTSRLVIIKDQSNVIYGYYQRDVHSISIHKFQ